MALLPRSHSLILGGIGSGSREYARELVADAPSVTTVTPGDDLADLADQINRASHDTTLLVEELAKWFRSDPPGPAMLTALADAIRASRARVVLVSPEAIPDAASAPRAEAALLEDLGRLNRALADACDSVVLVVAGQPLWLKGRPHPGQPGRHPGAPRTVQPASGSRPAPVSVAADPTAVEEPVVDGLTASGPSADTSPGEPAATAVPDVQPGLNLPMPDEAAAQAARARLHTLDIGVPAPAGIALGALTDAVVFFAGAQASAYPHPLLNVRVALLTGTRHGGLAAGSSPDPRSTGPLDELAAAAGAGVVTLDWRPASAPIEQTDASSAGEIATALRAGWAEAERAADEGIELLVLASNSAGAAPAAAAVVAALTGADASALLPAVVTPSGRFDDTAWVKRCTAVREALHRARNRDSDPREVLATLGGADLAAATGLLLGAAARRTPVVIDGPVGAAAALLARDFAAESRHWLLVLDHGGHPVVKLVADLLALQPCLDLRLDLGEGAASLAALPLLQTALTLAGAPSGTDTHRYP